MTGVEMSFTAHDPFADDDETIARRVAFGNVLRAESLPDDPPQDTAQVIAATRAQPERLMGWSFRFSDADGTIVASGGTQIDPEDRDNPELFGCNIGVHPDHRRRGLASRIFAELVAVARAQGCTRIVTNTFERVPAGVAAVEAFGFEAKQASHINHLPLPEVDEPLLRSWITDAPRRAADYELIAFDGPCPDEHLDGAIAQVMVLNTAPRDDLEMNDFTLTRDEWREHEQISAAAHLETWTLLARRRSDGAYAGMHDVTWNPRNPRVVQVGLTTVDPAHRGHALGKWLKATMTCRILEERPDVTEIRTGNADSNEAMLGINRAMGYRPFISATTWELSVDDAEAALASRGVSPQFS